jgi:hypothetical protein
MLCPACFGKPLAGRPCPECGGYGVVHCCEGDSARPGEGGEGAEHSEHSESGPEAPGPG